MPPDFYFLAEWILIRKQGCHQVLAQHADIGALFHIQIADKAASRRKTRLDEFIVRRYSQQNWRIALLVLVANRLSQLTVQRRDPGYRGSITPNGICIF